MSKSRAYQALFGPPEEFPLPRPAGRSSVESADAARHASVAAGSLDRVGCERIEGWAWDPQQPETPIEVEIYDGEILLGTVTADRLRQDLVRSKKGDGKHGFVFKTPASVKDADDASDPCQGCGSGYRVEQVAASARVSRAVVALCLRCKTIAQHRIRSRKRTTTLPVGAPSARISPAEDRVR